MGVYCREIGQLLCSPDRQKALSELRLFVSARQNDMPYILGVLHYYDTS